MEEMYCNQCQYYIQHNAFLEGKFRRLFCGHCTQNKKNRDIRGKICKNFALGESVENQLVTKEYLTKTLLHRVLEMELWKE